MSNHNDHQKHGNEHHGHHILPDAFAFKIWAILIGLTVFTVAIAQVDLGAFNFTVAMLVATVKAMLVCLFFMGLKYDSKENSVIFSTSVIFLAIFMILTFSDLLTRGSDVYLNGKPIVPAGSVQAKPKFMKPWVATPEMLAHGKEQFQSQCVTCHGATGHGDGAAAAGLNPKPRNFTVADGWKNGRKPSQVYATLTKGLGGMPSFASAPQDDRWSLVHYVLSLGPTAPADSKEDLAKIGFDPTKEDGGAAGEKVIPVGLAIDLMSESK